MTRQSKNITGNRLAWSLDELSASLGVSLSFVRKLVRSGKLPGKHIGRRVLVLDSDLRRYLDVCSNATNGSEGCQSE